LDAGQAAEVAGGDADSHQRDLHQAIERGVFPSWTLYVQLMPVAEAADYRFNPFDLTKVWPHADYPLVKVGRLVLNRNPENVFADVEQAAFSPNNFVPGIGPSPDKMLQGRLFAYADAQRYRLGVNHTQLPVNAPHATEAHNYGRDGLMAANSAGRDRNYEPNSYDGPAQTDTPLAAPQRVDGHTGSYPTPAHTKDDDFFQAGELYRLMSPGERSRLIDNIAGFLAQVSRDDVVEKNLAHFHAADEEYGARLEAAVAELRAGDEG
ncbi:catalase, partial [Streptomyces rubellomurinus subsp. indigoferus]